MRYGRYIRLTSKPLWVSLNKVSIEEAFRRELAKQLSQRLKELRKRNGFSQERVANLTGLNRNYYQQLESGMSNKTQQTPANPTILVLVKLAAVYKVSPAELISNLPEFTID